MNRCVVDASVVAAAFFHEEHAEAARRLLLSDTELHAPDLVYAELASVVWKRQRRGELAEAEAIRLLADILTLPLLVASSQELADGALQAALRTGRTVYDCLYLALSIKLKTVMVTADRRLANALAGGPLERHVVWIGDSRLSARG
jgi:predicted nucleic acid-binding protein